MFAKHNGMIKLMPLFGTKRNFLICFLFVSIEIELDQLHFAVFIVAFFAPELIQCNKTGQVQKFYAIPSTYYCPPAMSLLKRNTSGGDHLQILLSSSCHSKILRHIKVF